MVTTDKTVKGKDKGEIAEETSQASPGTEQGTPNEPQYVTMAQLDQAIKRAVNLDRMQHGRAEKVLRDRESEIARREREADEKIREALKDDSEKLTAYDMKKRADEDRRRAEDKEARANERLIKAVARDAGLDYEDLFDISNGNPDIAERLAERLKKVEKKPESEKVDTGQDTKAEEPQPPVKRMVSVSGRAAGKTGGLTVEDVKGMTPEEINANIAEIAALPLGGYPKVKEGGRPRR